MKHLNNIVVYLQKLGFVESDRCQYHAYEIYHGFIYRHPATNYIVHVFEHIWILCQHGVDGQVVIRKYSNNKRTEKILLENGLANIIRKSRIQSAIQ